TEAFDWLRSNKDKKFFLWIGSGLLHMPYAAAVPAPYKTRFDPPNYTPFWNRIPVQPWENNQSQDPDYDAFSLVYRNDYYVGFAPVYHPSPEDISYVNGCYDAGVYYTDIFIGELLKLLDTLDLTKKTLIVLHSIHGEDLGEQGNFFHYDISDAAIKNALLM